MELKLSIEYYKGSRQDFLVDPNYKDWWCLNNDYDKFKLDYLSTLDLILLAYNCYKLVKFYDIDEIIGNFFLNEQIWTNGNQTYCFVFEGEN